MPVVALAIAAAAPPDRTGEDEKAFVGVLMATDWIGDELLPEEDGGGAAVVVVVTTRRESIVVVVVDPSNLCFVFVCRSLSRLVSCSQARFVSSSHTFGPHSASVCILRSAKQLVVRRSSIVSSSSSLSSLCASRLSSVVVAATPMRRHRRRNDAESYDWESGETKRRRLDVEASAFVVVSVRTIAFIDDDEYAWSAAMT